MNTIWKYTLEVVDSQTVEMPRDAKILSAQMQNGKLCLWAFVNTESPHNERDIVIFGTGHKMPEDCAMSHIGTIQTTGGYLVWHIFEKL